MIYTMSLCVHPFFEASSGSYGFVVANPESQTAAIIDAPLGVSDLEEINTHCADQMIDWIESHELTVRFLLDTHVHADRPSATAYLKTKFLCAQTAIGAGTPDVGGYDRLLDDDEKLCLGHACGRVLATPGHTPGCVSYLFDSYLFVGDTMFMPDIGTARCDFPGGDAETLYASISKILSLSGTTKIFMCHDYPDGRRSRFVTTVAEEKGKNIHVGNHATCEQFVSMRTARDATLRSPKWADFSIPANLGCMNVAKIEALINELHAHQAGQANL